jgi:predicted acyltransferase
MTNPESEEGLIVLDGVEPADADRLEPPVEAPVEVPAKPERLLSIDALRGFDMLWIIGGDGLLRAVCKWWGTPEAAKLGEQFHHVEWEGFRFYDLIFPLFLFLVGVVIPFSLTKYQTGEHPRSLALQRTARRVVLLFLLGLINNGLFKLDFANLRIAGVLQRIAVCYGIAAVIYLFTKTRTQALIVGGILIGYWALLSFVPAPESHKAGDFAMETNLSGYLDRHFLPGKIYKSYYGFGDNEGLLSTIPAVATALLGGLAGQWLRSAQRPGVKAVGLIAAGAASVALGYLWGRDFPIIKILWTSTFVLVAGGFSLMLLGLFYTIIDVWKLRAWSTFFVVIGMNAITIYVAQNIIPFREIAQFFLNGVSSKFFSEATRPILMASGVLAVKWLFLYHLYRTKTFLRV